MRIVLLLLFFLSNVFAINGKELPANDEMLQWENLTVDSLRSLGSRYMLNTAGIDSAAICFTFIINKINVLQPRELENEELETLIGSLNDLAYIYIYYYFDYAKAYSYLDEAEEIAEKHKISKMLPAIYLNRAGIYAMVDQNYRAKNFTDNTIECYKKAFNGAVEFENWKVALFAYNNLLALALGEDRCDEIADVMEKFRSFKIPSNIPLKHFTMCHHLGVEEYVNGNHNKAIEYFKDMANPIDISEQPERKCLVASRNIAVVCERIGELEYGINTMLVAVKMSNNIGSNDLLPGFYEDLSRLYARDKNPEKAHEYRIKAIIQRDSIFNQGHLKEITKMKYLGMLKYADMQYRRLSYRKEIYKIVSISLGVIVFMLIGFFVYVYKSRTVLRKNYEEIYHKNEELMHLREEQRHYRSSPVNNEMMAKLYDRIINVMDNSHDIFSEGFSLDRLAELIDTKPNYISEVLAEHNTTFYTMLAEFRVQEACRRLTNVNDYGSYNIEGIGQSVGFKSRSNFSATFKRVTGLTPGQYQNLAKNAKK